jgi:Holliday junction resolvase RusA-like endonuclease
MTTLFFPFRLISKDNEKNFNPHGRPFLSKRFKHFEVAVQIEARKQYVAIPLTGKLSVKITAAYKDMRRPDCFNLPKSVCDALQGICYVNDKQIIIGEILVVEKAGNDNFTVMIAEVSNER